MEWTPSAANYVQGSLVPCKKEKTLSFDAEDEERKHLNGPSLLNVEAMEDAAEVNEAGDLAVCTVRTPSSSCTHRVAAPTWLPKGGHPLCHPPPNLVERLSG